MAGLDPAIHKKGVGARHKAGHDGEQEIAADQISIIAVSAEYSVLTET
jgi:hypothetical protein